MEQNNYTYVLLCADGSFYTGWTNDLDKRLAAHNNGTGGKYTRSRRPVKLLYFEQFSTREEAMRREYEIKHMSREQKKKLVYGNREKSDSPICKEQDGQ